MKKYLKKVISLILAGTIIIGFSMTADTNVRAAIPGTVDTVTATVVGTPGKSTYYPTELVNPRFDQQPEMFGTSDTIENIYKELNKQLQDNGYQSRFTYKGAVSVVNSDPIFSPGESVMNMVFIISGDSVTAKIVCGTWPTINSKVQANNFAKKNDGVTDIEYKLKGKHVINWRTTETTYDGYCNITSLYEWLNGESTNGGSPGDYGTPWTTKITNNNNPFVELNAKSPSTFYQDLSTNAGDIIIWGLEHATRASGLNEQEIAVTIGPPNKSGGNIVYDGTIATGEDTKFNSNGTITGGKDERGSANAAELTNLKMSKSTTTWEKVQGVYIIPENQTITRFAFASVNAGSNTIGNYMDNVMFRTLAGNLTATPDKDGNVIIEGYWGGNPDSTSPDKDKLEFTMKGTDSNEYNVTIDMKNVPANSDFTATIPAATIEDVKTTAGDIDSSNIHHMDYKTTTGGTPVDITPKVNVVFNKNGHGLDKKTPTQKIEPNVGKTATMPTTLVEGQVYDGYKFLGWYDGNTKYDFTKEIKTNKTLVAKWENTNPTLPSGGSYTPPSPSVTLNFDTNGNSGYDKPGSQSGASGFTGKVPSDIKIGDIIDGYKFTGWFKDKDGKEPFDFKTGITNSTTAYAGWEKVEEKTPAPETTPEPEAPVVKVEFETEIGVPPATQVEVPGNTALDPGAPMDVSTLKPGTVINGKRFEGWYLDKGYTVKYDFTTPLTEDIILYAKWVDLGTARSPKTGDMDFPLVSGLAMFLILMLSLWALSDKRHRDMN